MADERPYDRKLQQQYGRYYPRYGVIVAPSRYMLPGRNHCRTPTEGAFKTRALILTGLKLPLLGAVLKRIFLYSTKAGS